MTGVLNGIASSVSGCPNGDEGHCFVPRVLDMFDVDKSFDAAPSWVGDSGVPHEQASTNKSPELFPLLVNSTRSTPADAFP